MVTQNKDHMKVQGENNHPQAEERGFFSSGLQGQEGTHPCCFGSLLCPFWLQQPGNQRIFLSSYYSIGSQWLCFLLHVEFQLSYPAAPGLLLGQVPLCSLFTVVVPHMLQSTGGFYLHFSTLVSTSKQSLVLCSFLSSTLPLKYSFATTTRVLQPTGWPRIAMCWIF